MKNGEHQSPSSKKISIVLLAVMGGVLAWLVITKSLGAYLAETVPEKALFLRAGEGTALVSMAEARLDLNQTRAKVPPFDKKEVIKKATVDSKTKEIGTWPLSKWMKQALLDDPLNTRALRILGQLANKDRDTAGAKKYMQAAASLSIREGLATAWLMEASYREKDYGNTLRYADTLLWHWPQLTKQLVPLLASIAENDKARPGLEKLLASNPNWRSQFFASLPQAITEIRTPLILLLNLKKTQAPPTQYELAKYINFLTQKELYDLSYYTWLQFLPPEQLARAGVIFNGSFEFDTDHQMPFNWKSGKNKGVNIEMVQHPDNPTQRALLVELAQGSVSFGGGLTQMILLTPGNYILKGRYKGELTGKRGLRWLVRCVKSARGQGITLAKSPMFVGKERQWKRFNIAFSIPDNGCKAQLVKLILDVRTASEKLVSGSVWYDDLKIRTRPE